MNLSKKAIEQNCNMPLKEAKVESKICLNFNLILFQFYLLSLA